MNIFIVVYPTVNNLNQFINEDDYVIAVDRGLEDALSQNIKVDLAIGDFDSLMNTDLLNNLNTIKLNSVKDETDTENAIMHAKTLNPDHIYILGGIGGLRFEHSYANFLLVDAYEKLTLITNESKIYKVGKGVHITDFKGYINIFTNRVSKINLKGFKYPLKNYKLQPISRIGISNELIDEVGVIEVLSGEVIVIESKKDQ
ncbi:thiamine diphosphokinase [Acholeplasma granularum]|uniref:thiamine diphosphokinase n=1 Tax=Acholeplasma granularum TaxID=264635 RepID=UPI000472B65D|nr:thiamine diphosphokinase [Acholeplasma granularum]